MSCHLLEYTSSEPSRGSKGMRTIHDKLHVAHKTMNDLKRLSSSHARLVKRETIQPLENILDLALPQQFLRKLL